LTEVLAQLHCLPIFIMKDQAERQLLAELLLDGQHFAEQEADQFALLPFPVARRRVVSLGQEARSGRERLGRKQ